MRNVDRSASSTTNTIPRREEYFARPDLLIPHPRKGPDSRDSNGVEGLIPGTKFMVP